MSEGTVSPPTEYSFPTRGNIAETAEQGHRTSIQDTTEQQQQDTLTLYSLLNWIQHKKGKDAKMASLILATALKIKGSLTKNNVCAVERTVRDNSGNCIERESDKRNLNGVVQDANKVHKFLTQQQHMVECDMLVQRPNQGMHEMLDSIRSRFKTQDVDVIFLYYTGHGTRENGDWAIARAYSNEGFETISLHKILEFWNETQKARNKDCQLIIISDSCYSGTWVEEINQRKKSNDPAVANVSMVASCKAEETCSETADGGEFTTHLLRPLHSSPVYTDNIKIIAELPEDPEPAITTEPVTPRNGAASESPNNALTHKIVTGSEDSLCSFDCDDCCFKNTKDNLFCLALILCPCFSPCILCCWCTFMYAHKCK